MSVWLRPLTAAACFCSASACQMTELLQAPDDDVTLLSEVELAEDATQSSLLASNAGTPTLFDVIFRSEAGTQHDTNVSPQNAPSPFNLFDNYFTDSSSNESAAIASGPLKFGELRRDCNVTRRDLGQKVMSQSGFDVYDTEPGTTSPRLHHVTGFADGCPRAFSGTLVMFGDVGTHEFTRYAQTRVRLDYSETDSAYEAIKASFCRVSHGQPCGSRLERLGRIATFITVYERFGDNPEWAEFLLYDGTVAGTAIESL